MSIPSDFTRRDIALLGQARPVLCAGDHGPAVIVIHEVYGFTPSLARFCRWVRDGGMRVYAPILFGAVGTDNAEKITATRIASLCVSREFTMFAANRPSAVTVWLRALAARAQAECGGPGVGVVGMCLTGGFALAMAVDDVVLAPVMAQPGLPARTAAALDIAPEGLARVKARTAAGLTVRGYRFEGDAICRGARFETLRRELGAAFIAVELPDAAGNPAGMRARGKPPHSVLTGDLIDAPGEKTRAAADEVVAFLRERLGPVSGDTVPSGGGEIEAGEVGDGGVAAAGDGAV